VRDAPRFLLTGESNEWPCPETREFAMLIYAHESGQAVAFTFNETAILGIRAARDIKAITANFVLLEGFVPIVEAPRFF